MRADDSVRMQKLASIAEENDRTTILARSRHRFFDRAESGISSSSLSKKAQVLAPKPALVFHFDPYPPMFLPADQVGLYQEKVASNGVYIEDNRPLEKLAVAAEIPTVEDMTSDQPYRPSKVKLLDQAGKSREVTYFPSRFCYRSHGTSLILTSDNTVASTAGQLVVVGNPDDKPLDPESIGKPVPKTLDKGKLYLVADKDCNLYGPFYVDDEISAGIYRIDVPSFTYRDFQAPVAMTSGGRSKHPEQIVLGSEKSCLTFTDSVASDSLSPMLTLFVPENARLVEVKRVPVEDADSDYDLNNPRPEVDFSPMTFESLTAKDIAKLTVGMQKSASGRYRIAGRDMNKRAAMISLTYGFKLSEKAAEDVLSKLSTGRLQHFVFKNAATQQMMMEDPSAVFPQLEGPIGHSDTSRVPYVIDAPEQASETIPNSNADLQDPMANGYEDVEEGHPTLPGNSGAMGAGGTPAIPSAAQQVMGGPNQGPMDVTVLASIVMNSRIDSAISQAVGQILRGNSEIGQLLLLFYAQTSAFEDVYSETNMQSLEDTLVNAFDANGDLYLRLKQTNMASDPTSEAATPDAHNVEI
jgi:hypothetical protein